MAETELKPGPNAVDISPEKDGGVIKEVTTAAPDGDMPLSGDKVTVHYVGKLTDGSGFDSSRDRGDKFTFNLGKGEVIKGWDIGVATMRIGERAIFYIKSEYGYGATGSPPKIPGGATLVFDVELFAFQGEDISKAKDEGIIKRTKVAGTGYDTPNDGSQVEIDVIGRLGSKVFDERTGVEFELGEGADKNLPKGVELGLEKMKRMETAILTLKPQYGFKHHGNKELGVGPKETLTYEVTLKKFEKCQDSWQLNAEQKLEQAEIFKDKGTKFFKLGKYEVALTRYNKVIEFLEHEISLKGEEEEKRKNLLQAGRLNVALCLLKTEEWIEARNICSKIIEENKDSAKAWFRKGEANFALNDWEAALKDFQNTVALDAANKAAKNKVTLCEAKITAHKQREKKTFANMFDKFAAIDSKREEQEKKGKPDTMNNIDQWNSGDKSAPVATDPNSIQVGGDIAMNLDINQAIQEDQEQQAEQVNGSA